ncbi:hypothetical protein [Halanaerobium hydrogeniformans]|uniref:Uncharacterized protein n=1 Tax=Halanaerobium hydrogeniformans TaxID=656519 RepID=E4RNA5_HALHG|nr:hypothetical protein [Halanaerobium hydrogeniformans]ADQ13573.1 hypothetical protein Halsa_0077 [Halanaerobium hydrogeniformans]
MPIGGVPSDDWKVKRALGPYAKDMDELELKEAERLLKLKRKRNKNMGKGDNKND